MVQSANPEVFSYDNDVKYGNPSAQPPSQSKPKFINGYYENWSAGIAIRPSDSYNVTIYNKG